MILSLGTAHIPGFAAPPAVRRLGVIFAVLTAGLNAQTPPAAVTTEAPVVTIEGERAYALGFDRLAAFEYTIVDSATGATPEEVEQAKKRDQVPAWIKVYQDKRIALTGYMMPLKVENGLARKLIMMRDITTCCYGNVPNMNEYVVVSMKGEGVKAIQDVPVVLVGVLRIAEKYENGYIVSLFQMDGEKFLGPKK
jgi:hypothetical protein